MASSRAEPDTFGAAAALERMVFFSDAVFAIAMTLLVLNIPRPAPRQNVAAFLTMQDGKFVAFFISFWVIALFWMGHHRLFRFVRDYDHGLIMLNLALLFCIAFLPYPSAILGDHQADVGATVFYAAAISVTGFASASLTWYTVIHRHFTGPLHPAMARYYVFRGLAAPLVFLLSIPLAVANTTAAQLSWYLLFVLQFFGRRIAERRAGVDRSR
jgi:TMEM175 potassium channel family protein